MRSINWAAPARARAMIASTYSVAVDAAEAGRPLRGYLLLINGAEQAEASTGAWAAEVRELWEAALAAYNFHYPSLAGVK